LRENYLTFHKFFKEGFYFCTKGLIKGFLQKYNLDKNINFQIN